MYHIIFTVFKHLTVLSGILSIDNRTLRLCCSFWIPQCCLSFRASKRARSIVNWICSWPQVVAYGDGCSLIRDVGCHWAGLGGTCSVVLGLFPVTGLDGETPTRVIHWTRRGGICSSESRFSDWGPLTLSDRTETRKWRIFRNTTFFLKCSNDRQGNNVVVLNASCIYSYVLLQMVIFIQVVSIMLGQKTSTVRSSHQGKLKMFINTTYVRKFNESLQSKIYCVIFYVKLI